MYAEDIFNDFLQDNPLDMEILELEEVASDCLEIEEVTSDNMLLLEPLKDHNYMLLKFQTDDTVDTPPTNKPKTTKKLPKITQLMALYNCKLCGYNTMKKEVIEKHKESHRNIKLSNKYRSCDTCYTNNTLNDLYKCSKCSYTSKSNSSLKAHMHVHTTGTPYKCQECGYVGNELKDLINHYKTTTVRHCCEFCMYSSHLKNQYLMHQRRCQRKQLRNVVIS